MDKKFIKVSLIIFIPIILLIGLFSLSSGRNDIFGQMEDSVDMTYKGCKEQKNTYDISVLVKNNSKYIVSLGEISLRFDNKIDEINSGNFYIRGYESDIFDDNRVLGIDSGKEKEIIFKVPKGIEIKEDYYNLDKVIVDYNVNYYKFRKDDNTLLFGIGQMGGDITLGQNH